MSLTREETAQLGFAKYLLSLAKRHLAMPEPLASVGLLLLHDATEHLLVLACYRVGADPSNSNFLGYWDLIDKQRMPDRLRDKGRMAAFNKARVALKHHGIQPSRAQLQEFQSLVLSFFDTVVLEVFGANFASINLTAFVSNDEVRKHLEAATAALNEGDSTKAVTEAAYAFNDLRASGSLEKAQNRRDPFFGLPLTPPYIREDEFRTNREAHEFFSTVTECLKSLRESVSLLSLGIDLSRFAKFANIAPEVVTFYGGKRRHFDRRRDKRPHSPEEAEFCISFVIDSAFQVQQHEPSAS